jgi:hypothetical protein
MNGRWRHLVGFGHRVVYATLISVVAWYACTYPEAFGSFMLQKGVCFALTFPTAVVGRLTTPYRGIDVFFDQGGEWCDFCSAQRLLWLHVRFAVPFYVILLYVPNLVMLAIRRWQRPPPNAF